MSDEFLHLSGAVPVARPNSAEAAADPNSTGTKTAQTDQVVEPFIESIDRELDSVTKALDASLADFDTVVGSETKPGDTHGGGGAIGETSRGGNREKVEGADVEADAEDVATDRGPQQVRTMEIPVWLSTNEVTSEFACRSSPDKYEYNDEGIFLPSSSTESGGIV